jgi:hypothetical protein
MAKATMVAAEEAAEKADHIFQEAFGYSLTDDEQFALTNAIYRVFNDAVLSEEGKD